MTDSEIIELLGGVTAVARMLGIKPPSVHNWLTDGIPEGRLRELAGQIELRSGGRFSRRERWPDKFAFYWPELAQDQAERPQVAINPIAPHIESARGVPRHA
ncbi:MAG: Cro/CI family transcriptional regulator [Burkholderiales bacterium]